MVPNEFVAADFAALIYQGIRVRYLIVFLVSSMFLFVTPIDIFKLSFKFYLFYCIGKMAVWKFTLPPADEVKPEFIDILSE